MAGTNATDLYALALELLEASAEALDTLEPLGLDGAPTRQYVSPGEPAADNCCENEGQLTVHVDRILEMGTEPLGLAIGRRGGRHARMNDVGLIITVFRCVSGIEDSLATFTPPSAEQIGADAQQIHADGWALWTHLFNMLGAGTLLTRCQNVVLEGMRFLPPSGGCGGLVFAIRVALEGYEEAL